MEIVPLEQLRIVCSSEYKIRLVKSRGKRWVGKVERQGRVKKYPNIDITGGNETKRPVGG
jgi:hypothetical protein